MAKLSCPHCDAPLDVQPQAAATCPECGLDPDLPHLAFDDAPAFYIAGDPRHAAAIPIAAGPAWAGQRRASP